MAHGPGSRRVSCTSQSSQLEVSDFRTSCDIVASVIAAHTGMHAYLRKKQQLRQPVQTTAAAQQSNHEFRHFVSQRQTTPRITEPVTLMRLVQCKPGDLSLLQHGLPQQHSLCRHRLGLFHVHFPRFLCFVLRQAPVGRIARGLAGLHPWPAAALGERRAEAGLRELLGDVLVKTGCVSPMLTPVD